MWRAAGGPHGLDAGEDGRSLRAQLRRTATPGWGHKHLPSHKGRRVQSPGAEISHRGTWRWRAHGPPLKEHFLGGRVEFAQSDQVLCAEDVEGR